MFHVFSHFWEKVVAYRVRLLLCEHDYYHNELFRPSSKKTYWYNPNLIGISGASNTE